MREPRGQSPAGAAMIRQARALFIALFWGEIQASQGLSAHALSP